jgi:multidrug efflux pump subunit AcrB
MVLASVNESFSVPLAILFSVPPSLAVPAIFLSATGFPINTGTACAFVAVSGMTVNAAVLCAGGLSAALSTESTDKKLPIFRALRRNSPALLATTATTVAGAIPFLFLGENENVLVRTMAIVTALGVGGSCLCAVSVMPSLMLLLSKYRKKIRLSGKK